MNINTSTKIIIGSGISGLIFRYYHPDYHIISPEPAGGNYARTYLVWMHDTPFTRKLLKDLGWSNPENLAKKSYIGYSNGDWVYDYQTEWLNEEILARKMTPWNEEVPKSIKLEDRDLSLSVVDGVNYMNVLDVDLEEVVRRLNTNANIENGYVTKIEKDKIWTVTKFGDEPVARTYSNLVSTMPAPLFWKAYDISVKPEFKYVPITNVVVSNCPKMFDPSYEMIYYTKTQPFSRISNLRGKYAIELTGEMKREEFEKMFPELNIVDFFVIKQGRIWNQENEPPQLNITFLGRFAEWKHKIVTETVIKKTLDLTQHA